MCTVTLVPLADGFRLVCNRDESHTRPAALPPAIVELPMGITAIQPTDPQGGGTWVAVNSAGVALTILNRNVAGATISAVMQPNAGTMSRGQVIPTLLASHSVAEVERQIHEIDPRRYSPFRLLATDGLDTLIAEPLEDSFDVSLGPMDDLPLLLTSSGLGDALVEIPRRDLFAAVVLPHWERLSNELRAARQDAFHVHRWEDRPELSVEMSRSDARTVSRTAIEVGPAGITMRYVEVGHDETASFHILTMRANRTMFIP